MLQQTQVKTVLPYWERWMRELPTIQSAAKANPAKLHKLWEGLGYYTRVRNLQKAAQQIIAEHEGTFPQTFDDILALPGIGRYTAGAIASIAFNQPHPILDGNVIRVLTRIFGIRENPREKKTNAKLWRIAHELVKAATKPEISGTRETRANFLPLLGERAGVRAVVAQDSSNSCSHFNQSLMELGALICLPRSPQCETCPVSKLCVARKLKLQEQLPNLGKRTKTTARRFVAFVLEHDGKFLVRQRPDGIVNGHLWEFPNVEVGARHSGPQRAKVELGLNGLKTSSLYTIKHSITRYRITLEAYRAEVPGRTPALPGTWLSLTKLHKLAFSSAHKKILNQIKAT
jgi:A/G-specific adenine glycosylase